MGSFCLNSGCIKKINHLRVFLPNNIKFLLDHKALFVEFNIQKHDRTSTMAFALLISENFFYRFNQFFYAFSGPSSA